MLTLNHGVLCTTAFELPENHLGQQLQEKKHRPPRRNEHHQPGRRLRALLLLWNEGVEPPNPYEARGDVDTTPPRAEDGGVRA